MNNFDDFLSLVQDKMGKEAAEYLDRYMETNLSEKARGRYEDKIAELTEDNYNLQCCIMDIKEYMLTYDYTRTSKSLFKHMYKEVMKIIRKFLGEC